MARPDGSPRDVDREFINLFTVFDENTSLFSEVNRSQFAPEADAEDEDFIESNLMHSINGYVYGNLPGLEMETGDRVRWYLLGMGTEVDLHSPHWHGVTVTWNGNNTDVVELLPASMKVVDMRPDSVGMWMYHCDVNDHIDAGMNAMFTINPGRGF
jgi:FtsP/CotA-like multicopper oxidase with cupredoxin domain